MMTNQSSFLSRQYALHLILLILFWSVAGTAVGQSSEYVDMVTKWSSYEDIAAWLKSNFIFDNHRQQQVTRVLKENGPTEVPTRKAANLFSLKRGYCRDSASFAKDALNRINPKYNARYIFAASGFTVLNPKL